MLNNERDLITRLLKQNIVTLCKETVTYDTQLEIDGIICISTGNESQQIVVKVHNFFQKLGNKTPNPKSTDNNSQKQNLNDVEWEERKQERRYSLLNAPNRFQNEQFQPQFQMLKYDVKPKIKSSEIEERLRTPTINLATLNMNGYHEERQNMTPQIPKTISSLEQDETSLKTNDKVNDFSSSSDTMDYDDVGIEDDIECEERESLSIHQNGSLQNNEDTTLDQSNPSPCKQSPGLIDFKLSRKHSAADENSMIECKLGKNNTTDEDLSKVPIRQVRDIPCKRCGVVLGDGQAFEQHNTEVHSVYTCRVCFNTFTCRNNMKRHMRLHTGFRPYTCKLCSESFTRKDDIKRHLIRHSFDKPFRCNVCRKGYMDRKTVKNHIRKEHNSKIIHICQTCGEAFDNSIKFQDHKKNHPELKMFQCTLCKFTGSNLLAYNKHQLIHEIKRDYRCDPCGIVFGDPIRYTTHLRKHRSDPNFASYRCCFCDLNMSSYDTFVKHEHSHEGSSQLTCYVCMKQFQSDASLKEHKKSHPIYNVNRESESPQNLTPSVLASRLLAQQPIFPTFSTPLSPNVISETSEHLNIDIKVEPTSSDFDKQEDIEAIVKYEQDGMMKIENNNFNTLSTTSDQNDYWCGECQHGFATEHHLTEHIALAHEGNSGDENGEDWNNQNGSSLNISNIQPHFDDKLPQQEMLELSENESFDGSEDAEEHTASSLNSSSGSIRFASVPIFSNKGSRKANSRKPTKSTNDDNTIPVQSPTIENVIDNTENSNSNTSSNAAESPDSKMEDYYETIKDSKKFHSQNHFTCDICFLSFSEFEPYDLHSSVVHRKFVCHFCGKSFTSRPNRDRHVRYHTGEKPFKCDVCQQCFVRGDDLRYHRTSKHPDVKPYICSICRMSFPWAKDLERHAKTHGIS